MSSSNIRPADRYAFEVGIICALRTESDAVEAIFDEFWEEDEEDHYGKAPGDPNSYTLGRIGRHDVVLAHMPGMGKGSAASVAASFCASFPNIRLGLVVGICGGVPQPVVDSDEIFLGDVIVSTGLIQFDFGRQSANKLVRKDTLDDNLGRPNLEIRAFLHKVQGWRARTELRRLLSENIAEIFDKEAFTDWKRLRSQDDKLFHASYRHKHHDTAVCNICAQCIEADSVVCDAALKLPCTQLKCDESQLVHRRTNRRLPASAAPTDAMSQVSSPAIHFGFLGSGDVVMKSALHRDLLAAEENVIGFEMEGAGVWDNFPTIVIKGVCDYADSHKDKRWQSYASITAAACAKALLRQWRGVEGSTGPKQEAGRKSTRR